MALLEAAGTGQGESLSPDPAGRLRKAVDRVADQARRPAAEAGAPVGAGSVGSRPGSTARLQAASGWSVSSDWAGLDFPPAGRRCTVAPATGVSPGAVRGP